MSKRTHYRYPGSVPFMDSEHDRLIFFGREQESKLLFHKILSSKLLVMFANSGIGKTSLLNIGVSHPLRENDYIPLSIRLNDPKQSLLGAVYDKIDDIAAQQKLDFHAGDKSRLWHYFNTVEFWSSEDKLLTPVLIFDQFEELFTLHSSEARQSFITQLAELTKNKMPKAIKQSSPDTQVPNVKIVIAIREDYLALLDELSREIPDILHNRFRLQPLNRQSAQHAIEAPAALESLLISTQTFSYHPDAVTQMLDFLCMRHERGKVIATDEVESFQLQLLCGHLEELVEKKTGERVIEADDLGGKEGMRRVLKLFYERQVNSFKVFSTRKKVRKLCEKGLISSKNNRLSLAQEEIEKDFKLSQDSLNVLVKTRLLRTEPRLGSVHYELSHDTLVKPIIEAQRKRQNRSALQIGLLSFLLGTTMLAAAGYTYYEKPHQTETDKLYSQLEKQLNLKHFDKAKQTYQHLIAIDALSPKPYLLLGNALKLDKLTADKALAVFREAIDNQVEDAIIYSTMGEIYQTKSLLDRALFSYEKALIIDPKSVDSIIGIGEIYRNKREVERAIKYYKHALKADNKSGKAYIHLGVAYIQQGSADKALKVFEQAVEVTPGLAVIYSDLAAALKQNDLLDDLKNLFDLAANIKGMDRYYYIELGKKFDGQNRQKKAIEQYLKAIDIAPKISRTYFDLGNSYQENDEFVKAIAQFQIAIELNDQDKEAYRHVGMCFDALEKYDEAVEQYKLAIAIDPQYKIAYRYLGLTFYKQRKYSDAIEQFAMALSIDEAYVDAYRWMGVQLYKQNKYKEAIEQFKKGLTFDPDSTVIKINLIELLLVNGQHSESEALAQELLDNGNLAARSVVFMRVTSFFTLLLQAQYDNATIQIKELIKYYRYVEGDFPRTWDYSDLKDFISNNQQLTQEQISFSTLLIEILEETKEQGALKIDELEAMVGTLKPQGG